MHTLLHCPAHISSHVGWCYAFTSCRQIILTAEFPRWFLKCWSLLSLSLRVENILRFSAADVVSLTALLHNEGVEGWTSLSMCGWVSDLWVCVRRVQLGNSRVSREGSTQVCKVTSVVNHLWRFDPPNSRGRIPVPCRAGGSMNGSTRDSPPTRYLDVRRERARQQVTRLVTHYSNTKQSGSHMIEIEDVKSGHPSANGCV